MQNSINSDLIRGHIDTIILSILYVNDRYGYEILGEIDDKSGGQYKIKQPTLYSCLKRLETQGFIYSYRGDETESGGGRRKYYALTEMGKELFRKNQLDWEYSRTVIDKLVSDKAYQFIPFQKVTAGLESNEANKENENQTSNGSFNTISGYGEQNSTQENQTLINEILSFEEEKERKLDAYLSVSTPNVDNTENIDEYFSETESASYIDKVCGSSDVANPSSSFQIHNFNDDEEGPEPAKPFYDDEDDYTERIGDNDASLNTAHENNIDDEATEGADGRRFAETSVSDYDQEKLLSDKDEKSGLFKSYNVDISEVEEYDSGMSITKKSGKSIMDMLEEASRSRKTKDAAKDAESSAADVRDNKSKRQFESENDIVLNREYKSIIKQLLAGNENVFPDSASIAYAAKNPTAIPPVKEAKSNVKIQTFTENSVKQWREEANFDKVSDSVRNLGDDIKIRTYNSGTDKEYINMYYYFANKLMLYHYGVLFVLMLIEILAPFLIIKFIARIDSAADIPILILACVFAAVFPIYAVIQNFRNPNKRKRYNLDFRNSMLFRVIVLALLLVIIYLVNIIFKMDVTNPVHYLTGLIIPGLLATNVPVSLLVFKSMYNTQKFNTE